MEERTLCATDGTTALNISEQASHFSDTERKKKDKSHNCPISPKRPGNNRPSSCILGYRGRRTK